MYESEYDRTSHEADRCCRLRQEHTEKDMRGQASCDSWEARPAQRWRNEDVGRHQWGESKVKTTDSYMMGLALPLFTQSRKRYRSHLFLVRNNQWTSSKCVDGWVEPDDQHTGLVSWRQLRPVHEIMRGLQFTFTRILSYFEVLAFYVCILYSISQDPSEFKLSWMAFLK